MKITKNHEISKIMGYFLFIFLANDSNHSSSTAVILIILALIAVGVGVVVLLYRKRQNLSSILLRKNSPSPERLPTALHSAGNDSVSFVNPCYAQNAGGEVKFFRAILSVA